MHSTLEWYEKCLILPVWPHCISTRGVLIQRAVLRIQRIFHGSWFNIGIWHYYVRHKAETHENRRFFSTGMEFAENTYAYVLKAPSRS